MVANRAHYGDRQKRYDTSLQHQEMAEWYRNRYAEENPDEPPLRAIRYIAAFYPVGGVTPGAPGHWQDVPLSEVPRNHQSILYTHRFVKDR